MRRWVPGKVIVVAGLVVCAVLSLSAGTDSIGAAGPDVGVYSVRVVTTREARSAIAATGAAIEDIGADTVVVRATPAERNAIAALGFSVEPAGAAEPGEGPVQADAFPPADAGYHTYEETLADLDAVALAHPSTVRRFSMGSSYEGRDLAAVRISDDAVDTGVEPAVLLVGLHHAREHLTTEVVLSLVHLFAESTDPAVQALVTGRQIYILPQLNPDGGEYDVATGSYAYWRKNRQPNAGSTAVGTDLNRNYSYRWGCCGGSSGTFSSETYRGAAPFSAPETNALRLFVESHPNLRTSISYHSYGDLILYPYGYTYTDLPADMTQLDHDTFVAMANQMASTTGYVAGQASDLYITDGDLNDWLYGARHIYGFTFELSGSGYGFYPPDELIQAEIDKNRAAAIYAVSMAGCPIQAAGATCATQRAVADFDGDGDTDVGVFRPSDGTWYVQGSPAVAFGTSGDTAVPGDYDGNGSTNRAVYRPSTGTWYVDGGSVVAWGTPGDIPAPGDYDGNGTADIAVFRPSTGTWYVRGGATVAWGAINDVAVPGDYDGNGTTDIAVYRPSTGTWFRGDGITVAYGAPNDIPVPADYDGNGTTDVAVFRPSTGTWFRQLGAAVAWGASGDIPVPGDYDGNGLADIGVFRPSTGLWHIRNGSDTAWGTAGDHPLPLPAAIRQLIP